MKYNITLWGENNNYTIKEIDGEIMENEFMKVIIHRNIDYPEYWAISEYYTGLGLVGTDLMLFFKTKSAAIEEFNRRCPNSEIFPNPKDRKKYLKGIIDDFVNKYGKRNS